jgi:4-amino-4-deoxy-L-arabinose transferase-like glycosyltransferase
MLGILLLAIAILFISSVSKTPFHPDETSTLYQTRDLELLFSQPSALFWDPEKAGELDQTYRLLNPPLPKYIFGIARILAGYESNDVSVDWNWSKSWDENLSAGAFPEMDLLQSGRVASATMVLLALIPFSLIAKRMGGLPLVVIAILLFSSNALVLLHGRRLMSEGTLIFGISLGLFGILDAQKRPWLTGLGCAIAASSKLSASPLLLVGLIATIWGSPSDTMINKDLLRRVFTYLAVVLVVILLLNPILWSNPLESMADIWGTRLDFTDGQVESLEIFAPEYVLRTPVQRIAAMVFHLYIAPPQTFDVGNYITQTELAVETYLSNPINKIGRGFVGGAMAMSMVLIGIIGASFKYNHLDKEKRRALSLIFIATILQTAALLWANPVPFQRYYFPLVPYVILWMGLGIMEIYKIIKKAAGYSQRPLQSDK